VPIYRGEGGSGTGSSGKPGGGTGGGGSTGPVTTKDVLLTNPQSGTLVTQEDANQYFVDSIDDLNNSSGGGGFVDAPNDGQLYGRQSEAWAEIVIPDAGASSWNDLTDKPTEFPPETHGHEIDDVNGLQDALDAAGGTPAWDDVTGKPTEFPPEAHNQGWDTITDKPADYPPSAHDHAWDSITGKPADYPPSVHGHEIDEVNGLQDALDAAGGASSWNDLTDKPAEYPPEAHTQDWSTITNTPADYPPSAHNHDGVYQPVGDYIDGDAPNDGEEYARKNQGWVKLQDHNYTGADAVKLTGDQSVAGHKTWTDVSTFGDTVTMRGTLNGDDTANFQNAVTAGSFVKSGGTSSEYLMADGSVSSGPDGGGTPAWDDVTGKPTEFPPEAHFHPISDVTGLQGALDGKASVDTIICGTY